MGNQGPYVDSKNRSDKADAGHIGHFVGFVMLWLKLFAMVKLMQLQTSEKNKTKKLSIIHSSSKWIKALATKMPRHCAHFWYAF